MLHIYIYMCVRVCVCVRARTCVCVSLCRCMCVCVKSSKYRSKSWLSFDCTHLNNRNAHRKRWELHKDAVYFLTNSESSILQNANCLASYLLSHKSSK